MKISLSALDKNHFGVVTAKASFETNDSLGDTLCWCHENKVEFLIARIPTENISLAQELELTGFILTDTLVYFRHENISDTEIGLTESCPPIGTENNEMKGYSWRLAVPTDAEDIKQLAKKIFKNYPGHYYADRRLKKSDCDLVYSSWAVNSCLDKDFSDVFFLFIFEEKPVGFLTIKVIETDTGEIMLNGIHPDFQGKGLYFSLISLAKKWAIQQRLRQLIVSTQVTNLAVQKVWCRQGFEPYKSYYTFHRWFTNGFTNDPI